MPSLSSLVKIWLKLLPRPHLKLQLQQWLHFASNYSFLWTCFIPLLSLEPRFLNWVTYWTISALHPDPFLPFSYSVASLHQCQRSLNCQASTCGSSSSESCPQATGAALPVEGQRASAGSFHPPTLPWGGWLWTSCWYRAWEYESPTAWPQDDTTRRANSHWESLCRVRLKLTLAGFLLRYHPGLTSSSALLPNPSACLSGCC